MVRLTALSIALVDGQPPSEVRLFAAGENSTRKGTFTFDRAAADAVMEAYRAHGVVDLPIDYDHGMIKPLALDPAQSGKAAGWWVPELRGPEDAPELWATKIRWTEPAATALTAREWRFYSPAFAHDKAGRITRIVNFALTNLPATDDQAPLMAASMGDDMPHPFHVAPEVLTALGSMALDDIRRKVSQCVRASYPSPDEDAGPWVEAVYPDSVVFCKGGKLWQQPYAFSGTDCALQGQPVEVQVSYAPVTPPEGAVAMNQTGSMTAHQSGVAGKAGSPMKDLIVLLGLVAGTSEADAEGKVIALASMEKDVLSLSGQPTIAAALGTLTGWKAAADKLPGVESDLASLKATALEGERTALIAANQAKIAPAMMDWAKSQPIEALKAFLAVAPDLVALNVAPPAQAPVTIVNLSAEERAAALANGFTPEQFAAHKALLAQEGGAQ